MLSLYRSTGKPSYGYSEVQDSYLIVVVSLFTQTTLESGEILVSLCYKTHLERLTVGIFDGKNIKMTDDHSLPGKLRKYDDKISAEQS